MKRTLYLVAVLMVVIFLTSCKTTTVFVSGTPDTEIYTPSYKHIGTIGADGKVKIEMTNEKYYAFLLSKNTDSDLLIPFALDYEKRNTAGAHIGAGVGLELFVGGGIAMLAGAILTAIDEASPFIVLGGLAGMLSGAAIMLPCMNMLDTPSYQYQYKYIEQQKTNSDINFTKAVFNEPVKIRTQNKKQLASSNDKIEGSFINNRKSSQKSSGSLDNTMLIEKEYVGNGELLHNNSVIESYSNIRVIIKRINKNEVQVNVVESNGNEYFNGSAIYTVSKDSNGSFKLTHSTIPSATISIDNNGNLNYVRPRVSIEGYIYKLKISAK